MTKVMNPILLNRCLVDPDTNQVIVINGDGEVTTISAKNTVAKADDLAQRYDELKKRGIRNKSNPVTPEEKELHSIYGRLRYRARKITTKPVSN